MDNLMVAWDEVCFRHQGAFLDYLTGRTLLEDPAINSDIRCTPFYNSKKRTVVDVKNGKNELDSAIRKLCLPLKLSVSPKLPVSRSSKTTKMEIARHKHLQQDIENVEASLRNLQGLIQLEDILADIRKLSGNLGKQLVKTTLLEKAKVRMMEMTMQQNIEELMELEGLNVPHELQELLRIAPLRKVKVTIPGMMEKTTQQNIEELMELEKVKLMEMEMLKDMEGLNDPHELQELLRIASLRKFFWVQVILIIVYIYLMGYIERGQWGTYCNGSWEFRCTYVCIELRLGAYPFQKFREVASSHCNLSSESPKPIGVHPRQSKDGVRKPYYEPRVNIKQDGKSVRLPLSGWDTPAEAALIRDVAVFCLGKKTRSGLNADAGVYTSLAPISDALSHTQIAELIAERVQHVDWQAFQASFDNRPFSVQEQRHHSQALKSALNATKTFAQFQGPSDGDRGPELEPGNGCSGQREHREFESLRRAQVGLPQEPSNGPAPELVIGNPELQGIPAFGGESFEDLYDIPAPELVMGNPELQGIPATSGESFEDLYDIPVPALVNGNPEQMEDRELNMCVQGSMTQQDGTSVAQCQDFWPSTCAVNVDFDELVGGEPNESMLQEGWAGCGNNGSIPDLLTSANSPAIQLESKGFLIKAPINNQAHSLTTPVIDAMSSLLAFTSQNWSITEDMTTSECIIRIQKSGSVEDFKLSSAMLECLAKFAKLPGYEVRPL